MKILAADPAKNITVFILDPVEDPAGRAALARAILTEKSLKAEQVGFVSSPVSGHGPSLWHLEMAGGEFCGNAARCFGLYVARMQGLKGKANLFVSVSGAKEPVHVEVDTERSLAAAEMPRPLVMESLDYEGRSLPVLVFEGITHVIAQDLESGDENFYAIKAAVEKKLSAPAALGVIFYDTTSRFMRPAVYVRSVDTMTFESSCGSGSAALGIWLSREIYDGIASFAIAQAGGLIETEIVKKDGHVVRVTIGGEVSLGEPREYIGIS
jgi:diaminopimelate epimerase